jgi:inorganic pyrophosphatase
MRNIWMDVDPSRVTPKKFISVIEISKGSKMKYELDKPTGALILDRVLYTSTHYPHNYGFIPLTYAGDNDPLDVLVMCQEPIVPLTLVRCFPIGVVEMVDQGLPDEKIISVCYDDPDLNCYTDVSDLPVHMLNEICHFFKVYKQLEGKTTTITNILGRKDAERIIQESLDRYQEKFGTGKEKTDKK